MGTISPMEESLFWKLIEPVAKIPSHKVNKQERRMKKVLKKLSDEQLISFYLMYDQLHWNAERWDIWEVAYHTCGGCSDDGFIYFRNWLIGRGREAYYAVLANPDNLADYPVKGDPDAPTGVEWDLMPCNVWESRRKDHTEDQWFELIELHSPDGPVQSNLQGDPFDESDLEGFRKRYPRLSELHPDIF